MQNCSQCTDKATRVLGPTYITKYKWTFCFAYFISMNTSLCVMTLDVVVLNENEILRILISYDVELCKESLLYETVLELVGAFMAWLGFFSCGRIEKKFLCFIFLLAPSCFSIALRILILIPRKNFRIEMKIHLCQFINVNLCISLSESCSPNLTKKFAKFVDCLSASTSVSIVSVETE